MKKASETLREKARETMSTVDDRVTKAQKDLSDAEALPSSGKKAARVDAARMELARAETDRLVIARAVAQSLRDADDLEKASL